MALIATGLHMWIDPLRRLPNALYRWFEPNISMFLSSRQPLMWALAMAIGLLVSLLVIAFRDGIGLVQLVWLGDRSENVGSAAEKIAWYWILLAPVVGGALVGWCLVKLLPARRAGGVADVIEARFLGGRVLEIKSAIYSALVTIISLGSGASAGREGPMVHLGGSLAAYVAKRMRLPDASRRTLLACGVASAVSASFNAPIAGVLFAHEVILGHYSMRAFVPIVISSVGGTIFSRLRFGDAAAFMIPEYQISSFWEFPAFALLGIVCALVAILFQFALIGTDYVTRNITVPLWLRPIVGGLIIGIIGVFFPHILGVGYEAADLALRNQLSIELMLSLLVLKMAATAITLASRFGGGIFSPALYLGAMTGGAFGLIVAGVFPGMVSSEGLYAILGMGAVAAAVLGAPISTTVIVFELTGGYAMTIALLLTVSIASGINQAIHGHSYFQWQLEMRGLFFLDGPHNLVTRSTTVAEFMEVLPDGPDAETYNFQEDAPCLNPSDTLEHALRVFDSGGHQILAVADPNDPERIIATASQIRALRYFNRALIEASVEEHR